MDYRVACDRAFIYAKSAGPDEAGSFDHVEANREALRNATVGLREYAFLLARLQGKARHILVQHE